MIRIGHHRRFTANHTVHVDLGSRRLFVKLNRDPVEAADEVRGHQRLTGRYPLPKLYRRFRLGRWTLLAYQRVGTGRPDEGLLLDEITRADISGTWSRLDACLDSILSHYRCAMSATVRWSPLSATLDKLYGARARPGGRLDLYYGANQPLLSPAGDEPVRPNDLRHTPLLVNGRRRRVDFAALLTWLRERLAPDRYEWAAITQGDPTDLNIGWTPCEGPTWFDYDTGGLNAVAGEFANFLWYQHLFGGWLVPTYNPHAFAEHPASLATRALNRPVVHCRREDGQLVIDCYHWPSPARRHVIARYHTELIAPIAERLAVDDPMAWLRPWLVMRILAVYNLGELRTSDAAFCLASLVQVLDPDTTIDPLLKPDQDPSARAEGTR